MAPPAADNVVVSSNKLERLLSMKGGKGEASYANNCQAQVIHNLVFFFFFKIFLQKLLHKQNFHTKTHSGIICE